MMKEGLNLKSCFDPSITVGLFYFLSLNCFLFVWIYQHNMKNFDFLRGCWKSKCVSKSKSKCHIKKIYRTVVGITIEG